MLNFRSYLADRVLFIGIYAANVALILLVVNLGVLQRGTSLGLGDNLYIAVLSAVVLALYLFTGYMRKRSFYRQVRDAMQSEQAGMDKVLTVQSAADREERALQELLHSNYRQYNEELLKHRQREEQHHHFISQWVHQMKTPVSVIDLMIQQSDQKDDPLPPETKELLASIGEENERIAQGLSLILHTSRLDKFEMDAQIRRVELIGLLRRVINDYKKTWIRRSIYPKLETPLEAAYVESDEKWLSFMLHQMITNAIKYTVLKETAGAKIVFAVEQEGAVLHLRVKDEGIGIPHQDLPRIFDPFFTGENGRLTKESTGMGLFLAKQVCDRLGHGLEAVSEPGEGTVFTLTFRPQSGIHAIWYKMEPRNDRDMTKL